MEPFPRNIKYSLNGRCKVLWCYEPAEDDMCYHHHEAIDRGNCTVTICRTCKTIFFDYRGSFIPRPTVFEEADSCEVCNNTFLFIEGERRCSYYYNCYEPALKDSLWCQEHHDYLHSPNIRSVFCANCGEELAVENVEDLPEEWRDAGIHYMNCPACTNELEDEKYTTATDETEDYEPKDNEPKGWRETFDMKKWLNEL